MYEMRTRVRYSESDANSRIKITEFVKLMQDCCTEQAEVLGLGHEYLHRMAFGWYITSWQVNVFRLPELYEELVVKTWPYDFRGFFGWRNFTIETASGELLAQADSLWILMNMAEGKPQRLPQEMLDRYGKDPGLTAEFLNRKIPAATGLEDHHSFVVGNMHVDFNGHMNNIRYMEAAAECLPADFTCSRLRAEYRKEVYPGEELLVRYATIEGGYQMTLTDAEDNLCAVIEFYGA